MTGRAGRLLILALLGLSILLRSPLLLLLDVLLALVAGASALWGRYCLAAVSYGRRFASDRLFCDEETELWVEIVNAKPLPLAWLKSEDEFPEHFSVQRVELAPASRPERRVLINLLSLRWYERVRRRYRLTANHRGAHDFGPVLLSSGDIFGFQVRRVELPSRQTVLVYPKIVALEALGLRAERPAGENKAQRRVVEDPLRLAMVRDYRPGDSIRHVHWKTTARRGALQTKVFEPGASQHLVICLNGQTLERAYEGIIGDYFETATVVAASVAHAGLEARHPVGLFTNNGVREAERRVRLPASRHASQLTRVLEILAQLTYFTLLPFDQLLRVEGPQLPYGASVIAVSAIVTESILAALLALRDAGHPVALIAIGERAAAALPVVPAELPLFAVTKNWTELESLELD